MVHSGFLRQSINSNPSTVSYLLPLHQSLGGFSTSDFQSLEFCLFRLKSRKHIPQITIGLAIC